MEDVDQAIRWRPPGKRKRKSQEQRRAQTAAATATRLANGNDNGAGSSQNGPISSSDKENDERMSLQSEVGRERKRIKKYQSMLYNANKKARTWQNKAELERRKVRDLEGRLEEREKHASALTEAAKKLHDQNESLKEDKRKYQKMTHALKQKVQRFPQRLENAMKRVGKMFGIKEKEKKVVHLKEKGVIPDNIRDIICDLVALDNVPARKCVDAFKRIASGLGFDIDGDVSERSVNRIMKEGGVAAKIHLVESFRSANGIALSSDGTTHKNNNYESHRASTTDASGKRKEFFLGISMAANHTSETQRDGWIELVEELYQLFRESPFCQDEADVRDFWIAVTGMHTDHAEDQKKLFRLVQIFKERCEREKRGEKILLKMGSPELVPLLLRVVNEAMEKAGGSDAWAKLSAEEQKKLHTEAYLEVVREIGQDNFDKLSAEEKEFIDLFLWVGCCMHKEMNAFKGGVAAMEGWWAKNNHEPPVKMPNRDNSSAMTLAPGTAAAQCADEKSKGGAIKLASLAGAAWRHKDRKRGQQDTLRFYFDKEFGFNIEFPDTNNTRFQSHAVACAVIITYLDFFIQFLDLVKDNKQSRALNHMEANIYRGLQCNKTLHELAAVTLYHQTISVPYMREIRGPSTTEQNALRLGKFHESLKAHLRKLIKHPELAVGTAIRYETAAFDGMPWDRPDAIYAVQRHLPQLPYLRDLFVTFCSGALETWKRFTEEYRRDGKVALASEASLNRASMAKTNDGNESEFGVFRRIARSNPSMSLPQFNARQMYKQNAGTPERLHSMSAGERQAMRKLARAQDESGSNRASRLAIAHHLDVVATEKRDKDRVKEGKKLEAQARVQAAGTRIFTDVSALEAALQLAPRAPGYLSVAEIDLQLDWFSQNEPDSPIPKAKSARGVREVKCNLLKAAVTRFASRDASAGSASTYPPIAATSDNVEEENEAERRGRHQEVDETSDDSEAEYYGRSTT